MKSRPAPTEITCTSREEVQSGDAGADSDQEDSPDAIERGQAASFYAERLREWNARQSLSPSEEGILS